MKTGLWRNCAHQARGKVHRPARDSTPDEAIDCRDACATGGARCTPVSNGGVQLATPPWAAQQVTWTSSGVLSRARTMHFTPGLMARISSSRAKVFIDRAVGTGIRLDRTIRARNRCKASAVPGPNTHGESGGTSASAGSRGSPWCGFQ